MISLKLINPQSGNTDRYWRFTRYNSIEANSVITSQLGEFAFHNFRSLTLPGIVFGTDHGREVWNTKSAVTVYDHADMLEVATVNASMNGATAQWKTLDQFVPSDVAWVKITDSPEIFNLLLDHLHWIRSIPKVFIQFSVWSKTNIDWEVIFGKGSMAEHAASTTFVKINQGYTAKVTADTPVTLEQRQWVKLNS